MEATNDQNGKGGTLILALAGFRGESSFPIGQR